MFGGEAFDERQILVGGLAAEVAGLGLFQQDLPVFGGGVEGLPAVEMLGDALPADAAAAVEDDADLVLRVFLPLLPANIISHSGGTVALFRPRANRY